MDNKMRTIIEEILHEHKEREKIVSDYYKEHPYCLRCSDNDTPTLGCCKCARV